MYGRPRNAAYTQMEVLSTSPERLVPLLYEHLLVSLKRGGMQIRKGDVEGKFESLGKAADIVCELAAALDHEVEGPLPGQLASLYGFWLKQIGEAGRTMDAGQLTAVTDMVATLHDAWREAAGLVGGGGTVEAAG